MLAALSVGDGTGVRILRRHGVEPAVLQEELAALGTADSRALQEIGIDLAAIRAQVEATFGSGALDRRRTRRTGLLRRSVLIDHLGFSDAAKRSLEQALRCAVSRHDNHISVDHLLLGLLADNRDPAAQALDRLGVDVDELREQVAAEMTCTT